MHKPVALTIAGSDSGGGAGIQADLRAFQVFGVHGCTAITALTAQNPSGVTGILTADAAFVGKELDAIFADYSVTTIKTGMLSTAEIVEVVADRLKDKTCPLIIDPVMVATSGAKLLADNAINALTQHLLPLGTLLTPNLPEAELLLDVQLTTEQTMIQAARTLAERFQCSVLLKGGHNSREIDAVDILVTSEKAWRLRSGRIENPISTHGTGCSLSAAIAASLAKGSSLLQAVTEGKAYVLESIRSGVMVGPQAGTLGTPTRLPVDAIRIDQI